MKKWYNSKTIWLNIIAALLGILPIIDAELLNAFKLDTTKWLAMIGLITTVLNVILRTLTTKEIENPIK